MLAHPANKASQSIQCPQPNNAIWRHCLAIYNQINSGYIANGVKVNIKV